MYTELYREHAFLHILTNVEKIEESRGGKTVFRTRIGFRAIKSLSFVLYVYTHTLRQKHLVTTRKCIDG